jgi:hypothetical protein
VTYPEFYRIPGGDLLFFYRDGSSGNGNLMLNHYDTQTQRWSQIQSSFIHGEGQRNAYWQAAVDSRGVIHLSWVWRESGDVATNHDMAYARSDDGGITWKKSTGEVYTLPITAANAEYAARIPQNSELINQTSMNVDAKGRPYIVTYWRAADSAVPQYHIIYHTGETWKISQVTQRTTPFSLKGGGTRRILISRPKLLIRPDNGQERGYMLFRDAERGNRASLAICEDLRTMQWYYKDLSDDSLGQWEPSYDTERWREQGILSLFAQKVGQGEGETTEDIPPQKVRIIEWTPGL